MGIWVECGSCDVCNDEGCLSDCGQPVFVAGLSHATERGLCAEVDAYKQGLRTVTELVATALEYGLHVQTINSRGTTFVDARQQTFVR
jgi:hypothetical protein